MRNDKADLIYNFWRWEYLRRNPAYIAAYAAYNVMALCLNHLGINGLPYNVIGEDKDGSELLITIDFSKMIDDVLAKDKKDEMNEIEKVTLYLSYLEFFCKRFKLFPPLKPTIGLSAEDILKKYIQADIDKQKGGTGYIDYRSMVRLNHLSHPFSANREPEEASIEFPVNRDAENIPPLSEFGRMCMMRQSPTESEMEARIMHQNKHFLTHYPQFKVELPAVNSGEPVYKRSGKYFTRIGAPQSITVKDKKVLTATDKFLQSNRGLLAVKMAIRNRAQESLRLDKRRVKSNALHRAYGLFLWEIKKEKGALNAKELDEFQDKVNALFHELAGEDRVFEDDSYVFDRYKELKKLTKNTAKCIQKGDVLPIL